MASTTLRWLILGASGTVGSALSQLYVPPDVCATFLGRSDCDIERREDMQRALREFRPHVVINCAAWTNVDEAERSRHACWRTNSLGPAVVAQGIADCSFDTRLIHLSTDYVFGRRSVASKDRAMLEHDVPAPASVYGVSKLSGEMSVRHLLPSRSLIVRTAWVYGPSEGDFVGKMVHSATIRSSVEVVADQWGSPTYAVDLAGAVMKLAALGRRSVLPTGVIHLANRGAVSRFDLAQAIYREVGADEALVRPIDTSPRRGVAPRPFWSPLASERLQALGLNPLRAWEEALAEAVSEYHGR